MTLIVTLSELNQSASVRLKSVLYVAMYYCSCGWCGT